MSTHIQTIEIKGERYVVIAEPDYRRLLIDSGEGPPLPEPNASGNRPAVETMRAIMAREVIRDRKALGLTQTDLAELAGLRQETLSRVESGKNTPSERTMEKIEKGLAKEKRRQAKTVHKRKRKSA